MIKYHMLQQQLKQGITPIYLITGDDPYLANTATAQIKQFYAQDSSVESQVIDINSVDDWERLFMAANNYTLFTERTFIDARWHKKSFDAAAIKAIINYLNNVNPQCIIVVKAPLTPNKIIPSLNKQKGLTHIALYKLTAIEQKAWISAELTKNRLLFDHIIPELIYQHTQNNLLSSAQVIEKLAIILDPDTKVLPETLLTQLNQDAVFTLYTLTEACLRLTPQIAIERLQQLQIDKTEPTLILWALTELIRTLLDLQHLTQEKALSLDDACNQKKIWSQNIQGYAQALKRLPKEQLYKLLNKAQAIDNQIKSYLSPLLVAQWLEQLVLMFFYIKNQVE